MAGTNHGCSLCLYFLGQELGKDEGLENCSRRIAMRGAEAIRREFCEALLPECPAK